MRLLYSVILYLLLPAIVLKLVFRARGNPSYGARWKERFGCAQAPAGGHPLIWIHAVSVGEVRAAKPLVDALRRQHPGFQIMITTMTPTGADTVQQLFGNHITHLYAPYDFPDAVRRFIRATRPDFLLVMETELWPNLFHYCRAFHVPVVLVNGRMSTQSARRYRLAAALTRSTLGCLACISVQSERDAEQFVALGANRGKLSVTGSLKFDFALPEDFQSRFDTIRQAWNPVRPVWIAASTHAGEEAAILRAHARIVRDYPDCLLIIAPRHPERTHEIAGLCRESGLRFVNKTSVLSPDVDTQVFILDTLGELIYYYAMSQVAFVGGSLVCAGGQNMLEPAALGIPIVTGPHYYNFQEIGMLLQQSGAARVINNEDALAKEVARLFSDEKIRHDAGLAGKDVLRENRGSTDRVISLIGPLLNNLGATYQNSNV